jgi:hypothetical protein
MDSHGKALHFALVDASDANIFLALNVNPFLTRLEKGDFY